MIGLDLLYARYEFFAKELGVDINSNYYSILFQGNKQFEKSYKISKQELIKRYPR